MLSDNPKFSLKIFDFSLSTRKILVAEPNHQYLLWNLEGNLLNTITWKL